MNNKNYYSLLGVNYNASGYEIKIAFRELAKKYHPDKNIDNIKVEDYFKEIQEAYSVLSNPAKRKKYDAELPDKEKFYNNSSPLERQNQTKPDRTENYQFIISIIIALILLYFIVNYSSK